MLRIETDRLVLRTPTEHDLGGYLSYRNHPEDLEPQHLAAVPDDEARRLLMDQQSSADRLSGWKMLVIEPKARIGDQRVVGEVGVFLPEEWTGSGDIGWWLHPRVRAGGLATEAVRGLLTWCFETLQLHRVTAACLAGNERSFRLMKRLGMRVEARRRESRRVADRWLDEVECALLHSEWIATRRPR